MLYLAIYIRTDPDLSSLPENEVVSILLHDAIHIYIYVQDVTLSHTSSPLERLCFSAISSSMQDLYPENK